MEIRLDQKTFLNDCQHSLKPIYRGRASTFLNPTCFAPATPGWQDAIGTSNEVTPSVFSNGKHGTNALQENRVVTKERVKKEFENEEKAVSISVLHFQTASMLTLTYVWPY